MPFLSVSSAAFLPWILIASFGLLGIFSRYGLDRWIGSANVFPVATLGINILGSFLAGVIFALGERQNISPALQTGLLVGFCGGFTTFSAYALQTFVMVDKEKSVLAFAYLVASPALGLAAAAIPVILLRRWA